jgi:organic radical activating enzyme
LNYKVLSQEYDNKLRKTLGLKPVIPYIEVHLTDHCNLNCNNCSHFAPIADEVFADATHFSKDMERLSQLVSTVRVITLLGGEPLLHPGITEFISTSKRYFPKSQIQIISNGILLTAMNKQFWESCKSNSVKIELSIYPPFNEKQQDWVNLAISHNVGVTVARKAEFFDFVNTLGNTDQQKCLDRCQKHFNWPMLRDGKIYNCFLPALIHYYNRKYKTEIPNDEYIDIHNPGIDGWDVLNRVTRSTETCRYCTYRMEVIPGSPWKKQKDV